ncbi:MAG: PASTA domain-containing protein [Oscillospiraceae bacterium]|nr:PASTA domain-containing protein [Oscillospiraceae bacterium]
MFPVNNAPPAVSAPNRRMLRRALCLMALFGVALFALLLARLFQLQILEHERFERLALEQQLRDAPTAAARGVIYDTHGQPLAVSASVDNVYLSPAEIQAYGEDPALIARGLAEILGLDADELLQKCGQTGSWYVTVARKLEREQADAVRAFKNENNLRGVRLETDTKRYYPNSSLACHLIGFVGTDNTGLEGIEAQYDALLAGTAGRSRRMTNAFGTDLLFEQFEQFEPGRDGCDVVTTIDSTIQFYVEKQLRQAVADYDVQNGAGAIVMDVNTGAVLAMASLDGYDLNRFLDVSSEAQALIDACPDEEQRQELRREAQIRQWRNKALSDTYEPGSTFKIITLAMALEEGVVNEQSSFYCPGSVSVKGRSSPIRCWKDGGHGSQDLTQAVQHSCNAAFVNIGLRVGAERFYDYCEAFGLLEKTGDPDDPLTAVTGIDLAGESGSIWWSENTFCSPKNQSQLAAASFGQTFTITPLQLITAVSACVNGGYLMQPYVVRQILNPDGSVASERRPTLRRQVISAETSARVRAILEQVVGDPKEGTGRNAAVAGYRIGGKTGTSEKVSLEARTGIKQYIVSFIGVAPADDPQIAVLVFLDTPSNASGVYVSGGQMAAPVVGSMMADILPYLGVEPILSEEEAARMDVQTPALSGLPVYEAAKRVKESGLRFRSIGSGETVTDQLPAAGQTIARGTEIILYLGAKPSGEAEILPDLTGMDYGEARDALSYYGLYLRTASPVGETERQRVGAQSIAAGTALAHGSVVTVTLIDSDETMLGIY